MPASAEDLLYGDLGGALVGLDQVIAQGLDHDYRHRRGPLRALMAEGSPRHRLEACLVLAAWGVRDGLLTSMEWASDPGAVPWAGAPVSYDRMYGVDDAFACLAHSLHTAGSVDLTPTASRLRLGATRALLLLHDRVFFDSWMVVLLDDDLAPACRPEIGWAVERTIAAAGQSHPFDLAMQAAALVGTLAELDDQRAATAAAQLVSLSERAEGFGRALEELARSLAYGSGPGTGGVLERLVTSPVPSVGPAAAKAIEARRARGT